MAKNNFPSVNNSPVTKQSTTPARTQVEEAPACRTEGYLSRNMIDIAKRADTRLTTAQALKLREKLRELQDSDAKLRDGSYISCKSDAIRWMIEQPLFRVR